MNQAVGWGLAALALVAGFAGYGWPGLVLALTLVVFWLLLQFSRALRVMRKAGGAPLGSVRSAVMLHSRLREGMTLAQVIALTGSLGLRVEPPLDGAEESWRWRDEGDASVTVNLRRGRTRSWILQRGEDGAAPGHAAPP
jgi:hypothetical protein